MTKSKFVFLLLGTSGLFLAMGLTHTNRLLGTIVGYWTGFLYTQWLHKNTQRSVELEVSMAIRRMRRSFFARLGFVTLVVAVVGRYRQSWLLNLALGFALGLVISMIIEIKEFLKVERGEL